MVSYLGYVWRNRKWWVVLILIVMDNGLLLFETKLSSVVEHPVLILIVMDNGLLLAESDFLKGKGEVS